MTDARGRAHEQRRAPAAVHRERTGSAAARQRTSQSSSLSITRHRLRDWGLTIVLATLFVGSLSGLALAGWRAHNEDQRQHGQPTVTLGEFLRSGDFGEPIFENWESEFLEMTAYVTLTTFLFQRGSSESKSPDRDQEEVDEDPRSHRGDPAAPWPVRRGGPLLRLYENSLSLAFGFLFLMSFVLHATVGHLKHNAEQLAHGAPTETVLQYLGSSQFWLESFQNWQSEFLALTAMVVLSIFLRQRGSPESKPVATPTWDNPS